MNEVYKYLDLTRKAYESQTEVITQETVNGIVNNYKMAKRILCQLLWDKLERGIYDSCHTNIEYDDNDLHNVTVRNEILIVVDIETEYKDIMRKAFGLIFKLVSNRKKFPDITIDVNLDMFLDGFDTTLLMRDIVDNDDIEIVRAGFMDGNVVDDKIIMEIVTIRENTSAIDYIKQIIKY